MSADDHKLTEHERAIVRATVKEFMAQLAQGVGRGLIERIFWLAVGAMFFWLYGHGPK